MSWAGSLGNSAGAGQDQEGAKLSGSSRPEPQSICVGLEICSCVKDIKGQRVSFDVERCAWPPPHSLG